MAVAKWLCSGLLVLQRSPSIYIIMARYNDRESAQIITTFQSIVFIYINIYLYI